MGSTRHNGFTIVEVSAVLAITGLVFLAIMSGIGLAVQRQRFSDSVFSTQSYVQSQYNEVLNVINNRPVDRSCNVTNTSGDLESTPRGSDACVILGRALVFTQDPATKDSMIKTFAIIGQGDATSGDNMSSIEIINSASPRISGDPTSNQRFAIPWGSELTKSKEEGLSDIRALGIIRSPLNGSIGVYRIDIPGLLPNDKLLTTDTDESQWNLPIGTYIHSLDKRFQACMTSSGAPRAEAAFLINPTGSQNGVSVLFDDDAKATGVCS